MLNISERKHVVDDQGNLIDKKESVVDKYAKPKRKKWKIVLAILLVLIAATFAWFGTSAFSALNKIIAKKSDSASPYLSFLGDIKPDQLKGEGDGRINILIFGMGGEGHPGGQLADTIIVASFNPNDKTLALLSIPRDLYVPIEGHGSGKINSAYATGVTSKSDDSGSELLKKTISNILDIPIHYYVKADFSGFTKLVDNLGGVDINVEKAISDPYYPDEKMIGYSPFNISAGEHHLDGKTALKYARSRETTSDFDRSRRQQQLITAIRNKALSAGVLLNPKKLSNIINVLGDHIRTDMQLKEIQRFFELITDLDTSKITTKVIDNSEGGLLVNSNNLGGYYLVPKAGVNNFKAIQQFVHQYFSDPYLASENAKIEISNASGIKGLGSEVSDLLTGYGYNITKVASSDKTFDRTMIYDYSGGKKPFTTQFLANRFSAEVKSQPKPSSSNIDISVVIGKNYNGKSTKTP